MDGIFVTLFKNLTCGYGDVDMLISGLEVIKLFCNKAYQNIYFMVIKFIIQTNCWKP